MSEKKNAVIESVAFPNLKSVTPI